MPSNQSLKTTTLTLVLSPQNRQRIIDIVEDASSCTDAEECKAIITDCMILQNMPELGSTRGLGMFLEAYYGSDFEVTFARCLLGQHLPICQSHTSLPDTTVHHKEKYVVRCAALLDHSYAADYYILTGSADEDKLQSNGESQCIAGLIHLTARLAQKAVSEKKFFRKATLYGSVRQIDSHLLWPYKMVIDFQEKDFMVLKSRQSIEPSAYISAVKQLLEP